MYGSSVKRDWTLSVVVRTVANLRFHACLLLRKVHLFLYYLKIYKNFEHSSLE